MQNYKNKILPKSVNKYLQKYSYRIDDLSLTKTFECIVVIPILDEYENLPGLINSLNAQNDFYKSKSLFLFVVNNTDLISDEVRKNNQQSIAFLKESRKTYQLNIAIIDASSKGKELPDKIAGVGLARKIGMDTALLYFNYDSNLKKFLVCLDGDCTISNNYLDELFTNINKNNLQAGYVRYKHNLVNDDKINEAIIIYEIFLRYYLLGLKFANSPYAFHTIGSTMFCDYESYIKIEGMNKRKAAEDFYFMEKLSKNFSIAEIRNAFVYPSPRPSWRVPFGTGQRVNRFLEGTQNEFLLYSAKGFEILKNWLTVFNTSEINDSNFYLNSSKFISAELYQFLVINDFEKSWTKILENTKQKEQILKQKKIWFDGFRTLKLIHHLRDHEHPLGNMFDELDNIFRLINHNKNPIRNDKIPEIKTQLEYLEILRLLA